MTNQQLTEKYCITMRTTYQVTSLLGLVKDKHYFHCPEEVNQPCYRYTEEGLDVIDRYFNQPNSKDRWIYRMFATKMPIKMICIAHSMTLDEAKEYINKHFDCLRNSAVFDHYRILERENDLPKPVDCVAVLNAKRDIRIALKNINPPPRPANEVFRINYF